MGEIAQERARGTIPNGRVERANRTHTEEFYEVPELEWTVAAVTR